MEIEQRVQVEILGAQKPYSYAWFYNPLEGGQPLNIGDRVELPPNQVQEDGSSGTVVALGTPYKGELKRIVRKIEKSRAAEIVESWNADTGDLWAGWGQGDYA